MINLKEKSLAVIYVHLLIYLHVGKKLAAQTHTKKDDIMETFRSLVKAVQENNEINCASWNGWECSKHIQEIYGTLKNDKFKYVYETFLNKLICDNGENLKLYIELVDRIEYGYEFERN